MSTGRNRYTGPGSGRHWTDGLDINPANGRKGRWTESNYTSKEYINGEYIYVVNVTATFHEFEGNLGGRRDKWEYNGQYDQRGGIDQYTDGPFGIPISPYNTTAKHHSGANIDFATGVGAGNGSNGILGLLKMFSNLDASSNALSSLCDHLFGEEREENPDSNSPQIEEKLKIGTSKIENSKYKFDENSQILKWALFDSVLYDRATQTHINWRDSTIIQEDSVENYRK